MPVTVAPVLSADVLRRHDQPVLDAAGGFLLRPWGLQDAPAVLEAFSGPDIQLWHRRRMDDLTEAREWVSGWEPRWRASTAASWAITTAPTTLPIGEGTTVDLGRRLAVGYVALRAIVASEGTSEVSYWVAPAARGAGVAARAVQAVARWAVDDLGLHRLWLAHSTLNASSCAVASRAGFILEGTLREHMRHDDGWHDMHVHGLLAGDR